jgi:hypothetical protein
MLSEILIIFGLISAHIFVLIHMDTANASII